MKRRHSHVHFSLAIEFALKNFAAVRKVAGKAKLSKGRFRFDPARQIQFIPVVAPRDYQVSFDAAKPAKDFCLQPV